VLNQDTSNNFPTFAFALERVKIGKNKVVLSALFLKLDVSLEDLGVLRLESIIVVCHFLWH
jgi:hypothetical protein